MALRKYEFSVEDTDIGVAVDARTDGEITEGQALTDIIDICTAVFVKLGLPATAQAIRSHAAVWANEELEILERRAAAERN